MDKSCWWKLYCGSEFISYLGYRPEINDLIRINELHECYLIKKTENYIAYGENKSMRR